jgi:hypothetical protein
VVCQCVVGGVFCSGVMLGYIGWCVSVYLVGYCVALWCRVTESGVLVSICWCIV